MQDCMDTNEDLTCTNVVTQYEDVSVSIKMDTTAVVGNLKTECCGEPIISVRRVPGCDCSCVCEIIITQTICTRIPLEYCSVANSCETMVTCKKNGSCGTIYK